MATFERYFLAEKETHIEKKNPYYALLENETVVDNIMKEFGLDPKEDTHIVNGHVALYIGDGKIIHASNAATGIKISDYDYEQPAAVGTFME